MRVCLYIITVLFASCLIAEINKSQIISHVNFLASDFLAGRLTGSFGSEIAAKYLASELHKYGVKPLGKDGTFYQYIPMHSTKLLPETKLTIYSENNFREYILNQDYLVYKISHQIFLARRTEMVFAGFGIVAPEFDYNDYLNIDVRGKVVVVLDGEPLSSSPDFFAGERPTTYSSFETKQIIALSRGAAALIIISSKSLSNPDDWENKKFNYQFDDFSLAYNLNNNLCIILNPNDSDFIFAQSGYSLNQIMELAKNNKLSSFPLNTFFEFKPQIERHDFLAVNVIGIIQGSDEKLRDSYILVSAHYDHLGIGIPFGSDSIYNGLTDNALGCAVTLEIARRIMETKSKPKRSIIFLFTTAEEQGLLGSTYYCDYPARPLHKTVLNINIDGIAFLDRFKSVVAIGAEFLDNIDVLDKVLEQNNLYLSELPAFALDNSFVYSDNYSFARNGVPALLIMDGLDLENLSQEEALEKFYYYANNIYHTPNDDFKFQVNYEAVLQHANLLFDIVTALANSPLQPIWKQTSPFYDAWLRINAQKK
jgi:hypothetical protein